MYLDRAFINQAQSFLTKEAAVVVRRPELVVAHALLLLLSLSITAAVTWQLLVVSPRTLSHHQTAYWLCSAYSSVVPNTTLYFSLKVIYSVKYKLQVLHKNS